MGAQTGFLPAAQNPFKAVTVFNRISFTIGTKSVNTINVALQLQDARARSLGVPAVFDLYLSDNVDGSTLTATVPTSNLAVGTNGLILASLVTNKMLRVRAKSDGTFDLNIIQTVGGTSYYLAVVAPDGSTIISTIITF